MGSAVPKPARCFCTRDVARADSFWCPEAGPAPIQVLAALKTREKVLREPLPPGSKLRQSFHCPAWSDDHQMRLGSNCLSPVVLDDGTGGPRILGHHHHASIHAPRELASQARQEPYGLMIMDVGCFDVSPRAPRPSDAPLSLASSRPLSCCCWANGARREIIESTHPRLRRAHPRTSFAERTKMYHLHPGRGIIYSRRCRTWSTADLRPA